MTPPKPGDILTPPTGKPVTVEWVDGDALGVRIGYTHYTVQIRTWEQWVCAGGKVTRFGLQQDAPDAPTASPDAECGPRAPKLACGTPKAPPAALFPDKPGFRRHV
jgi:hypothetical protein